jgi:predicted PurR-regulated permease PerM
MSHGFSSARFLSADRLATPNRSPVRRGDGADRLPVVGELVSLAGSRDEAPRDKANGRRMSAGLGPDPPAPRRRWRRDRLSLVVIAAVAVIGMLKIGYPVAMPALFAAVVILAAWPFHALLNRWLPMWLSYLLTMLALLALVLGFAWAVVVASSQTADVLGSRWPQIVQRFRPALQQVGIPDVPDGRTLKQHVGDIARIVAGSAYQVASYTGLIAILVALGLPETGRLRRTLDRAFGRSAEREMMDVAIETSRQMRRYFAVMLFTSILTGLASAGVALATGLDLPLVWGLLNFLLNFIPVIGNIVGIVPPVLYAVFQFGGVAMPLAVFAGFAALQVAISYFVYPVLQGRQLAISPVVIVLAMMFWSWMWGIAGALLAVPLTVAVVVICEQSPRTRWLADLITLRGGHGR